MERPTTTRLRIGAWCVNPSSGEISRDGQTARLEERTMRLLLCLAEHPGEIVSIEDLLNQVWSDVTVTQDSVYQAVTSLRRLLGDDPKQPAYIATVPRLGYRMVATVSPWTDQRTDPQPDHSAALTNTAPRRRTGFTWVAGSALCLALVVLVAFQFRGKIANNSHAPAAAVAPQSENSIAVLPFLDLTEGMKEEEFADGMTEELIDKLRSEQLSRARSRRCSAIREFHCRAAVSRPDRGNERGGIRRWHDRGTDRQTQQDPGPSGDTSHVVVLFQGQTSHGRRCRQGAAGRLCTRWERAQVGRSAARRRAFDSCRQRVRGFVRKLRPTLARHPDGPGRHRRRSDESAEGFDRSWAGRASFASQLAILGGPCSARSSGRVRGPPAIPGE